MLQKGDKVNWEECLHGHGHGFFFYRYRCRQEPRLQRKVTYRKRDKTSEIVFEVDGTPCRDLDDALERLKTPPVLTPAEQAVYLQIGDEFADRPPGDGELLIMYRLADKGMIEHGERGQVRRRKQEGG